MEIIEDWRREIHEGRFPHTRKIIQRATICSAKMIDLDGLVSQFDQRLENGTLAQILDFLTRNKENIGKISHEILIRARDSVQTSIQESNNQEQKRRQIIGILEDLLNKKNILIKRKK